MTDLKKGRLTIKAVDGVYFVKTVIKDPVFVETLKRLISPAMRGWDGNTTSWTINPRAVDTLREVIRRCNYECPPIPPITAMAPPKVTRTFTVQYIGQCKKREGGEISALATNGDVRGYAGREVMYSWGLEFPEAVLKDFFVKAGQGLISDKPTYYATLGLFETASAEDVKKQYRRLARQWHPDTCREPEAEEMFKAINEANQVLSDPMMRRRYDAGLYFEREEAKKQTRITATGKVRKKSPGYYRSPLLCGQVTVEGLNQSGRFVVSKIIAWDDVFDGHGRAMSTSWDRFSKAIKVFWI